MQSNRLESRTSNTMLKSMILASLGMAVSLSSAAPVKSVDNAKQGELVSMKLRDSGTQSLLVENPTAQSSLAQFANSNSPYGMYLRNKVVVRTIGSTNINELIAALPNTLGSVVVDGNLGNRDDAWELTTQDVRTAIAVAEQLSMSEGVRVAFVDSGKIPTAKINNAKAHAQRANDLSVAQRANTQAPGVSPIDPNVEPAGTSDPDLASFWHLQNTLPIYLGRDNNITQDIYDVMGYTGAGITVGLARANNLDHLDFDHMDIDDNYDVDLSMPIDTTLFPPDRALTAMAGLIAGERDNGVGGHGIAPNARIAAMSTGTDLLLSNMLDYERNAIDVKVIPSPGLREFTDLNFSTGYNDGAVADYVGDFFRNSIKFGRDKKGSILVFSGGFARDIQYLAGIAKYYPDPYDSDKTGIDPLHLDLSDHGGIDELFIGNYLDIIDEEEGGGFVGSAAFPEPPLIGPTYIRAQSYMYPFASDRLTFLINSVGEDGNADMNQAIGPGVFASVYTGTSNSVSSFDEAITLPRGLFSTVPSDLTDEIPDPSVDPLTDATAFFDVLDVNGSSAAIAGGIIALMLEANPDLTIRDIQHILFESIFESTRSTSVKFPIFDPNRQYIDVSRVTAAFDPSDEDDLAFGRWSFWQVNAGLHPIPAGGVAAIRHSDQFGFGVIDAELAITKAETWTGAPKLFVMDTGRVTEDSGTGDADETRVPLEIPDAEWVVISDAFTRLEDGASRGDLNQIQVCVRNNLVIEAIVVELTVTGAGANDLFIELQSPYGTHSNLAYPTTLNSQGTSFPLNPTDDDRDGAFNSGTVGNTANAFNRHEFTTFKHWGELSGGVWRLNFYDFGPDDENEEGTPSEIGPPVVPAIPNRHALGVFGLPGSAIRDEKEVTEFRIKIYGYESGEEPFLGCNPFNTSCPADLNADGVVDSADFNLFLMWYVTGDIRADLNDNGVVDFFDISAFQGIFRPGFCVVGGGAPPATGGRPHPNGTDASDSNPPTRPI